VFELRCGKIEVDLTVEVRLDPPILRHRDDGVFPVLGFIHGLSDVDIEPALHELEARRDSLNNFATQAGLVERSHALLAVEQKLLGFANSGGCFSSLDWPACKRIGRARLDLKRHQRADWEGL